MYKDVKQYSIASFPNLKINFIAIPKTGTSSFLTSLIEESDPKNIESVLSKSHEYSHNRKFATYITPDDANSNNFLSVSILRNPIDRFISQYRDFFFGYKINHKTNGSKEFNRDWQNFKNSLPSENDFLDFILSYQEDDIDMHFRSQYWFVKYIKPVNNYFIRLENLNSSITSLNKISNLNLQIYNRNTTHTIKNINLNTDIKEKIKIKYAKDFTLWKDAK